MKKGHYGDYTGNARHSRKQEMIHDREMIYDAKTQIHNEDQKYKESGSNSDKRDMIHERELIHDTKTQLHHADQDYKNDSPLHYKPGDIHSGSTGAYDAENNEFSTAIAGVEAANKAITAFGEGAKKIITSIPGKPELKEDGGSQNLGMGENNKTNYGSKDYQVPSSGGGLNPYGFGGEHDLVSQSKKSSGPGGGGLSSFDNAWKNDLEGIRSSGMYGGSDDAAKARYIKDVGGQGETLGKGNAREYANEVLPFGTTYDSAKHQEDMMSRLFKGKRNSNIPGS